MSTGLQQIAAEYAAAKGSLVESVRHIHQCGVLLNAERKKHVYGKWLLWLERNEKTLGFATTTAHKMMRFSKLPLATNLTNPKALTLSRELWGHTTKVHGLNGKKSHGNSSRRAELIAGGISKTAADRVRYVEKNGIPELLGAVETGKLTPWQIKYECSRPASESHPGQLRIQ